MLPWSELKEYSPTACEASYVIITYTNSYYANTNNTYHANINDTRRHLPATQYRHAKHIVCTAHLPSYICNHAARTVRRANSAGVGLEGKSREGLRLKGRDLRLLTRHDAADRKHVHRGGVEARTQKHFWGTVPSCGYVFC